MNRIILSMLNGTILISQKYFCFLLLIGYQKRANNNYDYKTVKQKYWKKWFIISYELNWSDKGRCFFLWKIEKRRRGCSIQVYSVSSEKII